MKQFVTQIDNFQNVAQEISVLKKYGKDYSIDRGKNSEIINRLHPKIRLSFI